MQNFKNIDAYIKRYPKGTQVILQKLRMVIRKSALKAEEAINYGIPTFKLNNKPLVHFGAYEKHIGFYPTPSPINAFKKELSNYKTSKGAVRFPLDKELPWKLIAKIIKFRIEESKEFPKMSAPAERALANAKIITVKDLSKWMESDIRSLHGMGPSTIPILKSALKNKGLSFK